MIETIVISVIAFVIGFGLGRLTKTHIDRSYSVKMVDSTSLCLGLRRAEKLTQKSKKSDRV